MKITLQQLNFFKKQFNMHDKVGNEEIVAIKYVHWVKMLKQYIIGFSLNEGSTEIGFQNNNLIVGGNHIILDETELKLVNNFIDDNKELIEHTLV